MKCAWKELLSVLPPNIARFTEEFGVEQGQELRIRCGQAPMLICKHQIYQMSREAHEEDLHFIVNTASRYSPWAAQTANMGYITAPGGHRIGLCGEAIMDRGEMRGIRQVDSVCIRIARDHPGIAKALVGLEGSVLIVGPPGSGKTTLLRDLIRLKSHSGAVCVADERGEIFPKGFYRGRNVDVMAGADKQQGIWCLLRTMCPRYIAVDEISSAQDAVALEDAVGCGVELLATAHARTVKDLFNRKTYKAILEKEIFTSIVILREDQSWYLERVGQ